MTASHDYSQPKEDVLIVINDTDNDDITESPYSQRFMLPFIGNI